ncbi:MAG: hypothetical protein JO352_25845 [Chloroflexi bacterium]|nr:hypothetical protein [Chloroflexota bacterium]MBV9598409.1 hypothetical protein [Chloroflexota bacterium]
MEKDVLTSRRSRIGTGLIAIVGVLMIGTSFGINSGPPAGATEAELIGFAQQHYREVMWGACLQAVGPVLIIWLAFVLVLLADAGNKLMGMTLLGSVLLVTVSLIEVVFYISALFATPEAMGALSDEMAHAVQHLYFFVAAPAPFLPLGSVILSSSILPRILWVPGDHIGRRILCSGHSVNR